MHFQNYTQGQARVSCFRECTESRLAQPARSPPCFRCDKNIASLNAGRASHGWPGIRPSHAAWIGPTRTADPGRQPTCPASRGWCCRRTSSPLRRRRSPGLSRRARTAAASERPAGRSRSPRPRRMTACGSGRLRVRRAQRACRRRRRQRLRR